MNKKGFAPVLLVALIGVILVVIFVFFRQNKATSQSTNWITYEDPATKFSLQYPSDWVKIGATSPEDNPNRKFDYQYVYLIFAGKEGIITVHRASAFGGGCADYQPIQLKTISVTTCHVKENNKEDWGQIYACTPALKSEGFSIYATAYQPIEKNRSVILKILSSIGGVAVCK